MASRSDQLHSQQFVLQRVVGALAMRDPDPASSPLRRIGGALLAGLMLAALGLAAVGVYGVLRPGGNAAWRDGNSVIVEEETGARFVFRDPVLYPVLNYSSALLILGRAGAPSVRVSRASLAGVPRGAPLGIPGAPDLLPTPGDLTAAPWTLCSRSGGSPDGSSSAVESVLLVSHRPDVATQPLGERAVLAADPAGGLHLLWHEHRYAITAPDLVLAAFAWPRQAALPVAAALLNTVPAGTDLAPVTVPGRGRRSAVDGLRVGEVFVVENSSGQRQFGVALATGIADITAVQADLLLADNANGLAGRAVAMTQAQYAAAGPATSLVPTGDGAPPATTPTLARADAGPALCAAFADGASVPTLDLAAAVPHAPGEIRSRPAVGPAAASVGPTAAVAPAALADWVDVPPGRGAVVESLAGPGSPSGALGLVCDLGARFPVGSADVLALLGYRDVRPVRLPAALVSLLPTGPALDPASARRAG